MTESTTDMKPERKSWFARHKILTALGIIVLAIIFISALSSSGDEDSDDTTSTDPPEEESSDDEDAPEEDAGIGDPVRDGKFEFTVNEVECGETEVGDEFLNATAQGQFCFVRLTVSNVEDEPQTLFGDNQVLYDAEGREYSADTEAQIYLEEGQRAIFEEINPGNTVEGTVVFDVPENIEINSIELHDSAFSGGVSVNLEGAGQ